MCGIAGIYRQHGPQRDAAQRATDTALVGSMLRAIDCRGPDDLGIEQAGCLAFGARRLSILDVTGGHQPLADADQRVWAAQNGELYNFPELRAELAGRHRDPALPRELDLEALGRPPAASAGALR